MISSWQESGALVGAIAIITGGFIKVFGGNSKRGGEVIDAILKNQADQTKILERLALLIEHQGDRREELHRDTLTALQQEIKNLRID